MAKAPHFLVCQIENHGILSGVDSLTQATLGAAIGELVLGKKLGNRAIVWGAVFGTLPDLDVLMNPLFDTAGKLWWHRGPSHSLVVMTAASLLLARPLARLWQSDRVGSIRAAWFVFLVWSTHVLIDCFTSYGTLVLWPFNGARVAFNNLSIIDPLFTLPMLFALMWIAFLRQPKQLPKRRRINLWGMGLASIYVGLSFGAKAIASHGFEQDLERRKAVCERRIESPTLFNILLWRSVAEFPDEFWVGYRSLLDNPSGAVRWTVYPKGHDSAAGVEAKRELAIVEHFSSGWWIARPHAKGLWIGDLRFSEMRTWETRDGMVDHRLPFAWDLLTRREDERLRPKVRRRGEVGEMLKRLGQRAIGMEEAWEAQPRLEGVTGSLPEFLSIKPQS